MQCSSLDDLVLYQKIMEYSLAPVRVFTYKNPHMQQEKKTLYLNTFVPSDPNAHENDRLLYEQPGVTES